MSECKHHDICGLDAEPETDLCILHSENPDKDQEAFAKALEAHCADEEKMHNFAVKVPPPGPVNHERQEKSGNHEEIGHAERSGEGNNLMHPAFAASGYFNAER